LLATQPKAMQYKSVSFRWVFR